MISRLRLLQAQYSLSDNFIYSAIDSEIKRQAMLDINGAINNCSVAMLQDMMAEFVGNPDTPASDDTLARLADNIKKSGITTSVVNDRRGKKRG